MTARLIGALIVFVIIVIGIGVYLAPDDLADCVAGPDNQSEACSPAGAIVVVSGGDTAARTEEATKLFHEGWAPVIIFSGAAADKDGPSNAAVMREQAVVAGVPDEATVIEDMSETTRQNAEQVKTRLEERGISDLILVTSGYHMRRASLEFSSQLDGVDVRRHPVASDKQWSGLWWATPQGWLLALSELTKIGIFYLGASR